MSAENGIGTGGRLHAVDSAEPSPSTGQRPDWPKERSSPVPKSAEKAAFSQIGVKPVHHGRIGWYFSDFRWCRLVFAGIGAYQRRYRHLGCQHRRRHYRTRVSP